MENLNNNDIWILRTFVKFNTFATTSHENHYQEMIALSKHINKMTYRNRATNLRKVYDFLRAISGEYKKGEESFNAFFKTEPFQKTLSEIAAAYEQEIIQVTAE